MAPVSGEKKWTRLRARGIWVSSAALLLGLARSAAAQEPQGPAAAPSEPVVVAPRLRSAEPAEYPAGHAETARVVLRITVDPEGRVSGVELVESAGADFDAAALAAAPRYQFEPASRGGRPVAARVLVPFDFAPPASAVPETNEPANADPARPPGAEADATDGGEPEGESAVDANSGDSHLEVTVHGDRPLRTERRAASDYFIHREVLEAAPHLEGSDVLRVVPGLTTFRAKGLAIAPFYTLRGFDSDHGQDIEFRVGGLPINMPSHIHGQGYADLGFLIGGVVDEVGVSAGVSDPKQGDFAVAGSIEIGLGVDEHRRGLRVESSYGSFDTFRQLVSWSPKEASRESLGAAQYTSTGGFGDSRAGQSASGLVQHRFGEGKVTYRVIGIAHAARADQAGVVRRDDVDSGRVCFTCAYPYATAQAQNGMTQRLMGGFFADYRGPEHASGSVGIWLGHDNFRLQENYTGFLERSQTLAGVSGRGDLVEQRNQTNSVGLTGRYRTEAFDFGDWAHGTVEVGSDARFDAIEQGQSLIGAPRNQTWDRRVDASVRGMDIGFWGDLDWELGDYVRARLGARADVLSYEIDDRLGNFVPAVRPADAYIQGHRRSAMGVAAGPRASVEVRPVPWISLLAAYGQGYRSPQARTLDDGETAPFTKVHSGDVGVKFRFGEALELTCEGFLTRLSDDVAFDASEARLERIGATQRLGGTLYALSHPADWMVTAFSLTAVDATLLEPPPATAEEPAPPYVSGQRVPYVPPLVARVDSGVRRTLLDRAGAYPLVGRAGVGLSFLAGRPLPYGQTSQPVGLIDASLGVDWGIFSLSFEGFNLLNQQYAVTEYQYVSNWDPSGVPSRVPARHLAAGAPLSFLATLGVTL